MFATNTCICFWWGDTILTIYYVLNLTESSRGGGLIYNLISKVTVGYRNRVTHCWYKFHTYSFATDTLTEVQLQFYKMPSVFIKYSKSNRKMHLGGHLHDQDKKVYSLLLKLKLQKNKMRWACYNSRKRREKKNDGHNHVLMQNMHKQVKLRVTPAMLSKYSRRILLYCVQGYYMSYLSECSLNSISRDYKKSIKKYSPKIERRPSFTYSMWYSSYDHLM